MNRKFQQAADSLLPAFQRLIDAAPYAKGQKLPKQGVYLFCQKGEAVYVGRSNNIPQRRGHHTRPSAPTNQAALAVLIARKKLKLKVEYKKGARERLHKNQEFMNAFAEAKKLVRTMEFRAVEERDQTRQALLEIYCAITLDARYNDFGTH
jgi:hypothetical protein